MFFLESRVTQDWNPSLGCHELFCLCGVRNPARAAQAGETGIVTQVGSSAEEEPPRLSNPAPCGMLDSVILGRDGPNFVMKH